jgi:glutathione S-transferase
VTMTGWEIFGVERPFRLWSIRFSHYVEKARWAMDLYRVPYVETPMMPVTHFLVTPWVIGAAGAADSQSTRFSTPIVRTDRGERLIKSSAIMRYLSDRFARGRFHHLYPSAEVTSLDEHYNRFLGPHTRRLFYFDVLYRPEVIFHLADRNVPAWHAWLFKAMFRLCRRRILTGLNVTAESVERGMDYIRREFESAERRLRDGRPFLCGDALTAADISFACLGGAVLLPQPHEGYGAQLPGQDSGCTQLVAFSNEMRRTKVGT